MDCWVHPGVSGSVGLRQGPRTCLSNKVPWEADVLRLLAQRQHFENDWEYEYLPTLHHLLKIKVMNYIPEPALGEKMSYRCKRLYLLY